MPGLVAGRRSLLSEDRREKSGPSQHEVPRLISRFPGSFKEASESMMRQDQKIHTQSVAIPRQNEDGRSSSKDPVLVSTYTDDDSTCTHPPSGKFVFTHLTQVGKQNPLLYDCLKK